MGRDGNDKSDGDAAPNNVEPRINRALPLKEAKPSALSLAQFVRDNIALFAEFEAAWLYGALLLLAA